MSERRVTVVCGPPCAGKTTFVEARRRSGDVVADFDAIARDLGSAGKWMHSRAVGDAAERAMQHHIAEVAGMAAGRAWVVRCAPEPQVRLALAAEVRADRVVVLRPPLGVLLQRARCRPSPQETVRAVMRWLDRFQPADGDEVLAE